MIQGSSAPHVLIYRTRPHDVEDQEQQDEPKWDARNDRRREGATLRELL